ncbi:MAG: hypothetical protein WCO33_03420 [bacterium]
MEPIDGKVSIELQEATPSQVLRERLATTVGTPFLENVTSVEYHMRYDRLVNDDLTGIKKGYMKQVDECIRLAIERGTSDSSFNYNISSRNKFIYGITIPAPDTIVLIDTALDALADLKGQITFDELYEAIDATFGFRYSNIVLIGDSRELREQTNYDNFFAEIKAGGFSRNFIESLPYTSVAAVSLLPMLICMCLPRNILKQTESSRLPSRFEELEKYMKPDGVKKVFGFACDKYFVNKLVDIGLLAKEDVLIYLENVEHFLVTANSKLNLNLLKHLCNFEDQLARKTGGAYEIKIELRMLPAFVSFGVEFLSDLPKNIEEGQEISPQQLEEYYNEARKYISKTLNSQKNHPDFQEVYEICREGLKDLASIIEYYVQNPIYVNKKHPDWNRTSAFPSLLGKLEKLKLSGAKGGSHGWAYNSLTRHGR